jgi:hypothetical protein
MVSPILFLLKVKGYIFRVLLKRTRALVLKKGFLFGIFAFSRFQIFCFDSCKWGASCKPALSFLVLFPFFVSLFLCLVFVLRYVIGRVNILNPSRLRCGKSPSLWQREIKMHSTRPGTRSVALVTVELPPPEL